MKNIPNQNSICEYILFKFLKIFLSTGYEYY